MGTDLDTRLLRAPGYQHTSHLRRDKKLEFRLRRSVSELVGACSRAEIKSIQPLSADPKSPDILIVDDTPANLRLLAGILKADGCKVRPVTSGAMALQAARSSPPDLILLDINMTDMNGYEVCKALKADDALKDIPVLFISALGATEDKIKAFESGGVDYIPKPFQSEEVLARVKTHLHLRHLQLELAAHNARLEKTVQIRTREITEARDQLAEARDRLLLLDKAKTDFLALISHELRTPLNGIFGLAELMFDSCNWSRAGADLPKMYDDSRRKLLNIVDDALLLTQIDVEAGRFTHALASLPFALQSAVDYSRVFANSSGVAIGTLPALSRLVVGETEALSKALEALLETAIKFAKAGTTIRFSGTDLETGILLTIEASGRSILEKYLPRFFDVLAIADPIIPGGDLGLRPAVAERIITLFGGSVTAENLDPAGIRLTVRLRSSQ